MRRVVAKTGIIEMGDWTADAIEERRWLQSLVQSFANDGTNKMTHKDWRQRT